MRKLSDTEKYRIRECIAQCNRILWDRGYDMMPIIIGVAVLKERGYKIASADAFYIEHCRCRDDAYSMYVAATGCDAWCIKEACKKALIRSGARMVFPTTAYNDGKQYIAKRHSH